MSIYPGDDELFSSRAEGDLGGGAPGFSLECVKSHVELTFNVFILVFISQTCGGCLGLFQTEITSFSFDKSQTGPWQDSGPLIWDIYSSQ